MESDFGTDNPNPIPEKTQDEYPVIEEALPMSYLERAISSFLKKTFFGGYKVLISPHYALFFYYIVAIVGLSIGLGVYSVIETSFSLIYVERVLYLGKLTAVAFILGGLVGGLLSKGKDGPTSIFTITLALAAVLFTVWDKTYLPDSNFILWLKIGFILTFVIVSSISMFYIVVSFHSSLAYRVIHLGNSPNRLLFQPIIRIGAWISILMYLYLLYQRTIGTMILSITGLVISGILLIQLYSLPHTPKNIEFEQKEENHKKMQFKQVVGFYNLYLIYQISQSFNTGGQISNLIMDFFLLIVTSFFIINSLSRKVGDIADYDKEEKQEFKLRERGQLLMNFKKNFGEKSLIFMALGISLGYIAVLIDSFLGSPIPFVESVADGQISLNIVYHRLFLATALVLLAAVFINPKPIKELAANHFTVRHAFRMFGDVFRDRMGAGGQAVTEMVGSGVQKITELGETIKKGWKSFFTPKTDEDV